jgi:hypothetical protein
MTDEYPLLLYLKQLKEPLPEQSTIKIGELYKGKEILDHGEYYNKESLMQYKYILFVDGREMAVYEDEVEVLGDSI